MAALSDKFILGNDLSNFFLHTGQLLTRLNLELDPDTKIVAIKVGQQQLVEIAKALYSQASVIIMDEPTSAISDKEVAQLFSIIQQLKQEGKTIAYISHKFKELFAIADYFVVLRDGATVDAGRMEDATESSLIQKMTGRQFSQQKREIDFSATEILFEVKELCLKSSNISNKWVFNNISFCLKKRRNSRNLWFNGCW